MGEALSGPWGCTDGSQELPCSHRELCTQGIASNGATGKSWAYSPSPGHVFHGFLNFLKIF